MSILARRSSHVSISLLYGGIACIEYYYKINIHYHNILVRTQYLLELVKSPIKRLNLVTYFIVQSARFPQCGNFYHI